MAGKIWSAGSGISSSPSMQVPGLSGIELINDGSGLKSGGALWGWGIVRSSSSYSYSFTDLTPVQVPLSGVTEFSDGPDFGTGLLSDDSVMSWGGTTRGSSAADLLRSPALTSPWVLVNLDVISAVTAAPSLMTTSSHLRS